jgi:DNA-binding NarL/FixJ family response regulator
LLSVIRRAADGDLVLPSSQIGPILEQLQQARRDMSEAEQRLGELTSRELQVLQAMADGKSTPDIARELYISPLTVQTHIKNTLAKLGVHSKLEAVTFAVRQGLVRISSHR